MAFAEMNFSMLAPLIAVVAGALAVLVVDLVLPLGRSRLASFAVALASVALAAACTIQRGWLGGRAGAAAGAGLETAGGAYVGDGYTVLFHLVILGATVLSIVLSASWREMRDDDELRMDNSGYMSLLLLAAAGMMAMVAAGDLITLFVGLELLSLSLYVLVGFSRHGTSAREGAFKYFILGSVAAGFLLYGFALLYGEVGSVLLSDLAAHWQSGAAALGGRARMGIALAVVGFSFKLALVPFHAWAPDAYQGAPTPVTAFMAVGTKVAAFAALFRFLSASVPSPQLAAVMVPLGILAVLSMAVGSLGAMVQVEFKRLLAYSAIAHAGYLVLALSHRSVEAVTAGFLYLVAYGFTSLGAFAVLLWLTRGYRDGGRLETFHGLYYRNPWPALALTLFLLSMAGVPPTGGFVGKWLLVLAGVRSGAWLMITGLALTTGISAYVYLRVVKAMFSREAAAAVAQTGPAALGAEEAAAAAEGATAAGEPLPWPLAASLAAVIVVCAVGTLQLGLAPEWVVAGARNLLALP